MRSSSKLWLYLTIVHTVAIMASAPGQSQPVQVEVSPGKFMTADGFAKWRRRIYVPATGPGADEVCRIVRNAGFLVAASPEPGECCFKIAIDLGQARYERVGQQSGYLVPQGTYVVPPGAPKATDTTFQACLPAKITVYSVSPMRSDPTQGEVKHVFSVSKVIAKDFQARTAGWTMASRPDEGSYKELLDEIQTQMESEVKSKLRSLKLHEWPQGTGPQTATAGARSAGGSQEVFPGWTASNGATANAQGYLPIHSGLTLSRTAPVLGALDLQMSLCLDGPNDRPAITVSTSWSQAHKDRMELAEWRIEEQSWALCVGDGLDFLKEAVKGRGTRTGRMGGGPGRRNVYVTNRREVDPFSPGKWKSIGVHADDQGICVEMDGKRYKSEFPNWNTLRSFVSIDFLNVEGKVKIP